MTQHTEDEDELLSVDTNGEILSQILQELHDHRGILERLEREVRNTSAAQSLLHQAQLEVGTMLGEMHNNCRKRITVCASAMSKLRNEISGGDGQNGIVIETIEE